MNPVTTRLFAQAVAATLMIGGVGRAEPVDPAFKDQPITFEAVVDLSIALSLAWPGDPAGFCRVIAQHVAGECRVKRSKNHVDSSGDDPLVAMIGGEIVGTEGGPERLGLFCSRVGYATLQKARVPSTQLGEPFDLPLVEAENLLNDGVPEDAMAGQLCMAYFDLDPDLAKADGVADADLAVLSRHFASVTPKPWALLPPSVGGRSLDHVGRDWKGSSDTVEILTLDARITPGPLDETYWAEVRVSSWALPGGV